MRRAAPFLVSVLIPCRERSVWLAEAIASLDANASSRARIEILVRADHDDPALEAIRCVCTEYRAELWAGPRGRGYLDLHKMYSELARQSKGHWVWMFNDDARIVTPRWDDVLESCLDGPDQTGATEGVCLVNPGNAAGEKTTVFPLIRRRHVELFDQLTPSPANDHFLQDLYHEADAKYDLLSLRVEHKNNDPAGKCQTREDSIRAASPALEEHFSEPVQLRFWEMKRVLLAEKARNPRRPWE